MSVIIISALHVSGGFSAHHQELIKLYVQPWALSCFPAVYRWCGCGWDGTAETYRALFYFLDRAFSIMKTKINQQNAQINSG